jgi:predicted anti-sigma-YlaC factor YlaD
MTRFTSKLLLLIAAFGLLGTGCSIQRIAVNRVGDALAAGGTTFASDDDPELVKAAVPFSLKLMESLLEQNPRHKGLLLAASSGFTQYAYAFVQQDADEMEDKDISAAAQLRTRARRLYLRARNYGLRGLDVEHTGFQQALLTDPKKAVTVTRIKDVPLLYWSAVSWAAAISVSKDNPELIADIPKVEALIYRALELDESFDQGAIHTFLIAYEMSRSGVEREPAARARQHFERALKLSGGQRAAPMVAFAESISVQTQDATEFKSMLDRALAINPDTKPDCRLAHLVSQRRARWLLAQTDDLFLKPDQGDKTTP